MTRLAKALTVIASASASELRAQWEEAKIGTAPSVPSSLLRQLLAQRLQEKRYGGLPLMVVRELERVATINGPLPVQVRKAIPLTPGTRLIREWNSRTVSVEVREDGFYWEGQFYHSLSEIARKVTGAHWSGPRFFGLKRNG